MKLRTAPAHLQTLPGRDALGRPIEPMAPPADRLRGRAGVERRHRVLLRDGYTCQLCGDVHGPRDLRVDHITPLAMGGSDADDNNLRALCVPCHDRVTREEFGQRGCRP